MRLIFGWNVAIQIFASPLLMVRSSHPDHRLSLCQAAPKDPGIASKAPNDGGREEWRLMQLPLKENLAYESPFFYTGRPF
jgi:hypothetical protein